MNRIMPYWYHLAALGTAAVWGTTFVSTKVLMNNGLSPAEIFFIRFLLAYVAIWLVSPRRLWCTSLRDELTMAAGGICGGSLYFLTENVALRYAPASNVSLIVCTAPLWTAVLLSMFHRDERMNLRQIAGSVIAFTGVMLVVLNGRFVLHLSPRGDLLALAAAISWAFYSLIIKRVSPNYPALFLTRKIFFYGLLTILPILLLRSSGFDPAAPARAEIFNLAALAKPVVWANLLFLGLIASMLCYVTWNLVLNRLGVVRTTNYCYINPLTTMFAASLCIGERITSAAIAGAVLILTGMWYAETNRHTRASQPKVAGATGLSRAFRTLRRSKR